VGQEVYKVDFLNRQGRQDRQEKRRTGNEIACFLFFLSLALLVNLAVFMTLQFACAGGMAWHRLPELAMRLAK